MIENRSKIGGNRDPRAAQKIIVQKGAKRKAKGVQREPERAPKIAKNLQKSLISGNFVEQSVQNHQNQAKYRFFEFSDGKNMQTSLYFSNVPLAEIAKNHGKSFKINKFRKLRRAKCLKAFKSIEIQTYEASL